MNRTALQNWWRALRAYSFSATVIPVLCAFLFAQQQGLPTAWGLFPLTLLCALLLHAGVNVLNDYYDFVLGFDTDAARGSSGLLLEEKVSPNYMLRWGQAYVIAGAAIGLVLVVARGWPLLIPAALGTAGAWFYSHGAGYKYKGLGELFVFLLMGPLLFYGALYAACATLPAHAAWPAAACGCLVAAILLSNNLRDIEMDSEAGFTTLPMQLGVRRSKWLYAALIAAAFLMPVGLFATAQSSPIVLLPLLCLPIGTRLVRSVLCAVNLSDELANGPQRTAQLYLMFGLLLAAGLLLSN